VEQGGVVYLGTRGEIPGSNGVLGAGHAVAVEAATGRVLWKTPIPAIEELGMGGLTGAGALTPELFVVSSPNGRIYALDRATGAVRWETRGSGPYDAGVVVLGNVAITASGAGYVEGFHLSTGQKQWRVNVIDYFTLPLTVVDDMVLAVNGRLWAINAEGRFLWRHDAAAFVPYSTGAKASGNRIYVGAADGKKWGFYALRIAS
jgi:outer membrane protein assembly factor BamB